MLMCKIWFAGRLVVDIFPWYNANFVHFPSGTLVARRMRNGRINPCGRRVTKNTFGRRGLKVVLNVNWSWCARNYKPKERMTSLSIQFNSIQFNSIMVIIHHHPPAAEQAITRFLHAHRSIDCSNPICWYLNFMISQHLLDVCYVRGAWTTRLPFPMR